MDFMENLQIRFRFARFHASLPLGPEILAKSQLRRKKIDGVNPCAMVLVSEGSGGRKIEKNENLKFD